MNIRQEFFIKKYEPTDVLSAARTAGFTGNPASGFEVELAETLKDGALVITAPDQLTALLESGAVEIEWGMLFQKSLQLCCVAVIPRRLVSPSAIQGDTVLVSTRDY